MNEQAHNADHPPDAREADSTWEEYRLLQGKIDKIGEFHFHIRGWTVTLTTAILLATFPESFPPYAVLVGALLVAVFQCLEAQQTRWQRAFSRRLFDLEEHLRTGSRPHYSPRIAHLVTVTARDLRRGSLSDRLALGAGKLFYTVMYLVVIAAFVGKLLAPHPDTVQRISIVDSPAIRLLSDTPARAPEAAGPDAPPPVGQSATGDQEQAP
jgi:hypothetical protein